MLYCRIIHIIYARDQLVYNYCSERCIVGLYILYMLVISWFTTIVVYVVFQGYTYYICSGTAGLQLLQFTLYCRVIYMLLNSWFKTIVVYVVLQDYTQYICSCSAGLQLLQCTLYCRFIHIIYAPDQLVYNCCSVRCIVWLFVFYMLLISWFTTIVV